MLTVVSPPMEHINRPGGGTPFLRKITNLSQFSPISLYPRGSTTLACSLPADGVHMPIPLELMAEEGRIGHLWHSLFRGPARHQMGQKKRTTRRTREGADPGALKKHEKRVKNALFATPFDDPPTHPVAPPTPPTLLVTGQSETDLTGIDGDEKRI
jgi:hypothetical protein